MDTGHRLNADPNDAIYGSFWKRIFAYFLDGLVIAVCLLIFLIVMVIGTRLFGLAGLTGGHRVFFYVFSSLFSLGYMTYFIGSTGQTVGKKTMDLKVSREDGGPVGYFRAFARAVSLSLYSLPLLIGVVLSAVSLWLFLTDSKKRALHDRICSTVVREIHA